MEYVLTEGNYRVTLRNEPYAGDSRWVFHVDRLETAQVGVEEWVSVADVRTPLPYDLNSEDATRAVRRIADTLLPMVEFANETDFERYAQHVARSIHQGTFGLDAVTLRVRSVANHKQSGYDCVSHAPLGLSLPLYRLLACGLLARMGIVGGKAKMFLDGKEYDL